MDMKLDKPLTNPDQGPDESDVDHCARWEAYSDQRINFYNEVGAALGMTNSTWADWDVVDFTARAFEGKVTITYSMSWGKTDGRVELDNPTWADVWKAADQLIKDSGDQHHVFIEAFDPRSGGTYDLVTGS